MVLAVVVGWDRGRVVVEVEVEGEVAVGFGARK